MPQPSFQETKSEQSSGNVFSDLRLPRAGELKAQSALAIEITTAIRRLRLTQRQAAERMGVSRARVASLLKGNFTRLSKKELTNCLDRLGSVSESERPSAGGNRVSRGRLRR